MKKKQFHRRVFSAAVVLTSHFNPIRRAGFPRRYALLLCGLAVLLLSPAALRAVDFLFTYDDPAGQGFFDPVLGDQRRAALNAGANLIGQLIRPTYADETVVVRITSYNDPMQANTLAKYTSGYFYADFGSSDPRYQTSTHYPKPLASHLLGHNIEVPHEDIHISFNFFQPFYLGTDANPPNTQYDFESVAVHEVMHGLGFFSSLRQQGGYGVFGDGTHDTETGVSGLPVIYDRFTTLGIGGPPVITLSEANRKAAGTSGNLYWSGSNGAAGNAGAAPKLDAVNPWVAGENVGHIDNVAFPNDIIAEGIGPGTVKQTVSAVDRGILRDMGWDISVATSDVTWAPPSAADNHASTLTNWSQSPYPGDRLTFGNNAAGVVDVRMDLQLYQLDQITFPFDISTPAYTLRFSPFTSTDLTGYGIKIDSGFTPTIILESHEDAAGGTQDLGSAAVMTFKGSATASHATFEVHAGFSVPQHFPSDHYDRFNGAQVNFYNSSTANTATFNIQGAAGDGAPGIYGSVNFRDTANAGAATINNQPGRQGQALSGLIVAGFGGQTAFYNTASASVATINNIGQDSPYPYGTGGITNFHDGATASHAVIHNQAATAAGFGIGVGGATQFFDQSTAANATITNEKSTINQGGGSTYFGDTATAGHALIDNLADDASYGGKTTFEDHSSAASAVINNRGGYFQQPGVTGFHDDASAASATIHNSPGQTGGRTEFFDRATAGNAHIVLDPGSGGTIIFHNTATAGSAHLDASAGATGSIQFLNQSSAGNATIDLDAVSVNGLSLIFWDDATAANAHITTGYGSNVFFYNNSTIANATITVGYNSSLTATSSTAATNAIIHLLGGSSAGFSNFTTALNTQFTVDGASAANTPGAQLVFSGGANAGNANVLLKSSTISGSPGGALFFNGGTAPDAHITAEAGSLVYIIENTNFAPTSLGSLEGAGAMNLNSSTTTVGALGLSTTFSGPITGFGGSLIKTGAGTFTFSGAGSYTGSTTVNGGALAVNGSIQGNATVNSGAALQGIGSIGGLVTVNGGGILSPGNSPGILTVGALTLNSNSQTKIELGGTARGSLYDAIVSNGAASLNGMLSVSLTGGFSPALGNSFDIFDWSSENGIFGNLTLPALSSGLAWNTTKLYSTGLLSVIDSNFLPGDVNRDTRVDVADISAMMTALSDLSTYQATHGPSGGPLTGQQLLDIANLDNDNSVTNTDLQALIVLLANGGGSGGGSLNTVPEPASVNLWLLCGLSLLWLRRSRQSFA